MSDVQRRKAVTLIKAECANYDRQENACLLLSDYHCEPCPQLHSNSLICRYFRDAVLPGDKLLHAEIMGESGVKGCEVCGKPFRAVSPRAKYCESCAKSIQQKQARERKRRSRQNA